MLMSHAPNSPDLNLEMWQWVYQTKLYNAKELSQCIIDMWHDLKQNVIDDAQLISVVDVPAHHVLV